MATMMNDGWNLSKDRMPEEHDSIFKKLKGTDKWRDGMFETMSDRVDITVEYPDGLRMTDTGYTVEGKWKTGLGCVEKGEVIAWQPKREPYKGGLSESENQNREAAEAYCEECDHIEMCRWYPFEGCEFRSLPKGVLRR
jgi:hypothetical protein